MWGWILRAHRGPHGVKHKGPISCSQHKQNGHKSSSVALTYRFSHFTDFPTLRIIIRPRALGFKGINRLEYQVWMSYIRDLGVHFMNMWPFFISCCTCKKIFIFFIDTNISSSWSIVFQGQYGLRTQEGHDMQLIGIITGSKQGFCIFPEENERLSDACQHAFTCQQLNAWPELTDFHFHLFQTLVPKSESDALKCRFTLSKYKQQIVPVNQIHERKLTKASKEWPPTDRRQWWKEYSKCGRNDHYHTGTILT